MKIPKTWLKATKEPSAETPTRASWTGKELSKITVTARVSGSSRHRSPFELAVGTQG